MELAQKTVGSALQQVGNIKNASQGLLYDVYRLAYGPEGAALLQGTVPNRLGEMLIKVKPNDPGVPFLTLLPSGWPNPSTTPQQLLNLLAMPRPNKPMEMIWLLLPLLAGHLDKAESRARLYNNNNNNKHLRCGNRKGLLGRNDQTHPITGGASRHRASGPCTRPSCTSSWQGWQSAIPSLLHGSRRSASA